MIKYMFLPPGTVVPGQPPDGLGQGGRLKNPGLPHVRAGPMTDPKPIGPKAGIMDKKKRYTDYNSYLRALYGERVQKISVDAGLTCPNRDGSLSHRGCIYCNDKGSGTGRFARGMGIKEQIEAGRIGAKIKYKAKKFLAYFQSYTNTYCDLAHMKALYDEALSCEGMVGMAVGTRPDCIDGEKLDLVEAYARDYLVWLEYGLQSVHDKTLALINRGHDFKTFADAVDMTQNRGINICTHIILGLPGEDRKMISSSSSTPSCYHHFRHHQFSSSFWSATSSTAKDWHCL